MLIDIIVILIRIIDLYQLILIGRILLTWLPSINWYNQPFKFLRDVTDPILAPFSRLIPPVGGMDFSPMLVFLLLGILRQLLASLA